MQPDTMTKGKPSNNIDAEQCFLNELRTQLGSRNFDHWFKGKVSLTINGDELTVGVGNLFLLNWMQKHFRKETSSSARFVLGPSATVQFTVDTRLAGLSDDPKTTKQPAQQPEPSSDSRQPKPSRYERRFADLADFVQGKCNEMAVLAATCLTESRELRYNPLFLHGGVGTGKTHLLEGIYRKIRRDTPQLKTLYLTAESFTNFFTQALRERSLPSFRQRFRNIDVLLVDDISFLNDKPATQEEFLHTFQELVSHDRQIVLTADRHPKLLSKMSESLTTRFVSGLVCRIESPDLETRLRIVERKAARLNARISKEALRELAKRFQSNIRELEGGLNCLATYHSMTGKTVSRAMAQTVLAELASDCIRAVRIHEVESAVCDLFGIDGKDLKSGKRQRSVSHPRMLAMFLSRKLTHAAYSEIGAHFGGRNHSTVMSAERKVRKWLSEKQTLTVASQTWPLDEVLTALEHQLQAS
jgi:chromosomal replication initiator protein